MGNILLSKNAKIIGVIKFHWVVPPQAAKAWVKRAPKKIYKTENMREGESTVSSARLPQNNCSLICAKVGAGRRMTVSRYTL
jgi:hypothetical protein